jgi:hypothetical protein
MTRWPGEAGVGLRLFVDVSFAPCSEHFSGASKMSSSGSAGRARPFRFVEVGGNTASWFCWAVYHAHWPRAVVCVPVDAPATAVEPSVDAVVVYHAQRESGVGLPYHDHLDAG